jgi:hypothetical protein
MPRTFNYFTAAPADREREKVEVRARDLIAEEMSCDIRQSTAMRNSDRPRSSRQ